MKKIYVFSLYPLLWVFATPSVGQISLTRPDSLSAPSPISVIDSQPNASRKHNLDSLHANRIPVKAGDSITVTAVVLDNTGSKGRFWKSLSKAIIPAFVINGFTKKQTINLFDQSATTKGTTFGASLALVPAAIDLLKNNKSKAMIGLRAYDQDNQLITTRTDFMTKAARKDWQELHIKYQVEKDGFIDVLAQKDSRKDLLFTKFGQDHHWLQVTQRSQAEPDSSPYAGSGGGCTAWYWCTSEGCDYLYTTCDGMAFDDGNGSSGSSSGNGDNDALGQCSQTLNIALDRCLQSFAIKCAAAAAMSEAPPAAAALIIEAAVENFFCKENAYQDFDICVSNSGFYRH